MDLVASIYRLTPTTMLELDTLCISEGAAPVSAHCDAGTLTVVLGRNLSGKSQLCRIVAGLDRPHSGSLRIDGAEQSSVAPRQRPVAMVYQAFVNYPHWTVAQNIASPLVAQGVPTAERNEQVGRIAASLGLEELLQRLPDALSGGQQQRLAIARALAKRAQVLVMDEPFVNLDFKLREVLRDELRQLVASTGLTVLYTTSDPTEAFALADQLMLMAEQSVVQIGTPLEIYRDPNGLLAADLMSDPGVNKLQHEGMVAAVRPEHVRLMDQGEGPNLEFPARVLDTETNGSETFVHAQVNGEAWVIKLSGLHRYEPGRTIPAYVAQRDLLKFNERVGVSGTGTG